MQTKERYRQWFDENRERLRQRQRVWYEKNKEKVAEDRANNPLKYKNRLIKSRYGISLLEYDRMYQIQSGRCAICSRHQSSLKKPLNIDHRHNDKQIRGLLCHPCNIMIGLANEDTGTLLKAVAYLEK